MKTKKLTITAILSATSLIIFVLESQIPPLVPVPGVKLGLANVITLYTMATLGPQTAFIVLLVKIFLGNLFTGTAVSLIYSLTGGILCFLAEYIMFKFVSKEQLWAVSITGAVFHNAGQIIAAIFLLGTDKIVWYLAVLVPVAVLTGVFTGLCAKYALFATEKFHFSR